jgi:DNA polymerase III subunit beta
MTAVAEKEIIEMNEQIEEELKTNITFEIKTDLLKKLVSKVERATAKTTTIPIMQGIYMSVTSDQLTFRAMNSNFGVEVTEIYKENEKNFKVLDGNHAAIVFADRRFASMVNSLPRKTATIIIRDKKAVLKSGRAEFQLNVLDGAEFPQFPRLEDAVSLKIEPVVLSRLYDKTVFATSTSEARPVLTGVYHTIKDKVLTLVATDSFRLAHVTHDILMDIQEVSAIVPGSTINELMKHLKDAEEVTVHFMENQVIYEFPETKIFARLIDGNYPNVNPLIPKAFTTEIQVKVYELLEAIKRALIMNPDEPVKIKIRSHDKQFRLLTRENENGVLTEDLMLVNGEGDNIQFGMSPKFLKDALEHYPKESVVKIQFVHQLKPFVIRALNGDDRNLDLLLPVKMSDPDMQGEVIIEDFKADVQLEMIDQAAEELE